MTAKNQTDPSDIARWLLIGGLVVVAFFGAYKFAQASGGQATPVTPQASTAQAGAANPSPATAPAPAGASGSGSAAGGCACCGGGSSQPTANGVTGPALDGTAQVSGGVQAISVTVSTAYSPNVIHLKAGVPAQITFSVAQGCTSQVQSQSLGFSEDLSAGPKVVIIESPKAGTYDFACGMNMVHGKIVVE